MKKSLIKFHVEHIGVRGSPPTTPTYVSPLTDPYLCLSKMGHTVLHL